MACREIRPLGRVGTPQLKRGQDRVQSKTELEGAPMTIVVGLDVHREQITFDALDTPTGEVRCGRVRPADRESFRRFLSRFDGAPVEVALEATTGWRFIVEELQAAGA